MNNKSLVTYFTYFIGGLLVTLVFQARAFDSGCEINGDLDFLFYLDTIPTNVESSETEDRIFVDFEVVPRFPGCEQMDGTMSDKDLCAKDKLLNYIYSRLKYPLQAKLNKIEGTAIIQFYIEENGEITDVRSVRDPGYGIGEEALRIVNSMKEMPERWIPGMQRGKAVRVSYTLPIKFKLEPDNEEKTIDVKEEDKTYAVVEQMPRFPGCEDLEGSTEDKEDCAKKELLKYIYKNLTYPSEARINKVEGTAVTQFIVEKDGKITNIKLLRDPGAGLGEAAYNVIDAMNDLPELWTPGRQRGKAVKVLYTFPVVFKLEVKNSSSSMKLDGEKVHEEVKEMPRFPGCEEVKGRNRKKEECATDLLFEYIYSNMIYPAEATYHFKEGVVGVDFVVDKNGKIRNIKIVDNPGFGMGKEAIRIIESMNNLDQPWTPGYHKGEPVNVLYQIDIHFELE